MLRTQLQQAGTIPHTPLVPDEAEATAAVEIRPARMDDERRVRDFVAALSPRTQTLRFFAGVPRPGASLVRAMIVRDERRHALLAVRPGTAGDEIVAHAMSCHTGTPGSAAVAEIAVVVADAWQGRGIGRRLVERLVLRAAACGVAELGMDIMGENRRVLRTVRRQWPDAVMRVSSGTVEVRAGIADLVSTFAE